MIFVVFEKNVDFLIKKKGKKIQINIENEKNFKLLKSKLIAPKFI